MAVTGWRARTRFYGIIGGYRVLAWLSGRLPFAVTHTLALAAGIVGPRLVPVKRNLVARHITKVTGQSATNKQVQEAFRSYVRFWFDAFRVPSASWQTCRDSMMGTTGLNHITDGIKEGKGVILALPHMGNWDVAGAWLVANDVPLTVVAEALEPPEMFEWFANFRSSFGLKVVANGPKVGSVLLAALKRNEAIALLCDRDVDGTGGEFEFFGETTTVPKGPATLALRTGAALIPVGIYEDGNRYRCEIQPAMKVEREGKLGADVDRVTTNLITEFERLIRKAPEQWHVFQPFWPSDRLP